MKSWQLPSFDIANKAMKSNDVADKSHDLPKKSFINQNSAEITNKINSDVEQENYASAFKQGLDEGYLKASQEFISEINELKKELKNYQEQQLEQQNKLNQQLELLVNLKNELEEHYKKQISVTEQAILKIINKVIYAVLVQELKNTGTLRLVIKQALDLITPSFLDIKITANSQDSTYISEVCATLALNVSIINDNDLLPGGCIITHKHGIIDASIEQKLQQILVHLQ